jgi:HSP20 family protein
MYKVKPYRRNDIFDVFEDFFNERPRMYGGNLKVDVRDLAEEYIVDVDVPGLTKEDLEIHFENERLIIAVNKEEEKETENDNYVHRERYTTSTQRSIYLKDVDPSKFSAKLEHGVLKITAKKQEEKINKYMIDIE